MISLQFGTIREVCHRIEMMTRTSVLRVHLAGTVIECLGFPLPTSMKKLMILRMIDARCLDRQRLIKGNLKKKEE